MSSFGGLYITRGGRTLQSKTIEGKMLKFTGIRLGDGNLTGDIEKLTDLVNTKIFLDIASCKINKTGEAIISFTISNQNVTVGFYMREIGLYAEDPDTGNQVLYAYANAGTEAEYIPNYTATDIINKKVDLILAFENNSNVVIHISEGLIYVTQDELDKRLNALENKIYTVTPTQTISKNTDYQTPATYEVGSENMELYWEGVLLVKNINYKEIGESGQTSSTIQFIDWDVDTGETLVFKIKGDSVRIYTVEEAQSKIESEYVGEGCYARYEGYNLDKNYVFTVRNSETTALIETYIVDRFTLEVSTM